MTLHERLGEVLRAFKLSRGLRRPENAQPFGAETVDDPGREGSFGAHDREGHVFAAHELDEFADIGEGNVFKAACECRAGVARSDEHFSTRLL